MEHLIRFTSTCKMIKRGQIAPARFAMGKTIDYSIDIEFNRVFSAVMSERRNHTRGYICIEYQCFATHKKK